MYLVQGRYSFNSFTNITVPYYANVTCLIVVKCLWRQSSQPLTGHRGPASKVLATNVIGVKELQYRLDDKK